MRNYPPKLVDGCTTFETASDAKGYNNICQDNKTGLHSLVQALANILASRVKCVLENQIQYADMVMIMQD